MNAWADNPQAAEIDALIERAGPLTAVECDRLVAAWVAGLAVDRVAARVAARDAAWAAARDADWFAARVAAWGAARDAAWFGSWTVGALVVRDLIDEATEWNQAAYDLVTGPWRRVVGPIHPDDEVLR